VSDFDVKHRSRALIEGPERAAARAYLHGVGYSAEDLAKPIVGVAHSWIETMPCNFNNRVLAAKVKEGIRAAGGTPMELNTIAISDGITMGTAGMRASLVSRELIADSIELVASAHCFDALVTISGCDKTIPGTVMALARLDIPGVMLYGGSIRPGHFHGHDVTIQQVFEAVGAFAAGKITEDELHELEQAASPGAGACAGQFTANTMAMAFEVLGISPAGSAMVPAEDGRKLDVARGVGELAMDVLRRGLRPSEVITKAALENAIAAVATSGGSTNGVLHLLAVAHEMGVPLEIDEFDAISERTPLLCDLQPGGQYVATDLYAAGGVPLVLKRLQEARILRGEAITVTGRTIGAEAEAASETAGQRVVRALSDPLKPTGGFAILRGNIAPDGCVVKSAGCTSVPRASSRARRPRWPQCSPRRSRPATSSSSAARVPPAAPGCARCSPSPPRSSARDSARASRSSPTGASPAPPTASWPPTSPPRPCAAGRSARCATAMSSRSTSKGGASMSRSRTSRLSRASPPTRRASAAASTSRSRSRSTRSSSAAPRKARSPAEPRLIRSGTRPAAR
jgi:dihydroxy-acid dehydratase